MYAMVCCSSNLKVTQHGCCPYYYGICCKNDQVLFECSYKSASFFFFQLTISQRVVEEETQDAKMLGYTSKRMKDLKKLGSKNALGQSKTQTTTVFMGESALSMHFLHLIHIMPIFCSARCSICCT